MIKKQILICAMIAGSVFSLPNKAQSSNSTVTTAVFVPSLEDRTAALCKYVTKENAKVASVFECMISIQECSPIEPFPEPRLIIGKYHKQYLICFVNGYLGKECVLRNVDGTAINESEACYMLDVKLIAQVKKQFVDLLQNGSKPGSLYTIESMGCVLLSNAENTRPTMPNRVESIAQAKASEKEFKVQLKDETSKPHTPVEKAKYLRWANTIMFRQKEFYYLYNGTDSIPDDFYPEQKNLIKQFFCCFSQAAECIGTAHICKFNLKILDSSKDKILEAIVFGDDVFAFFVISGEIKIITQTKCTKLEYFLKFLKTLLFGHADETSFKTFLFGHADETGIYDNKGNLIADFSQKHEERKKKNREDMRRLVQATKEVQATMRSIRLTRGLTRELIGALCPTRRR